MQHLCMLQHYLLFRPYIMTLKEQNGLPRSTLYTIYLVTWYASVSHTQTEKLCKLQDVYYATGCGKDFEMFLADSKFELPRMKKGGTKSKHQQWV